MTISDLPGQIPSGAPLLINIDEDYNFYSGNRIVSAPYMQDIVLYSLNRPELTAGFPVTPSYTFEPLTLEQGVIDVDALAPTDMDRGLSVIAPEGGTVTLPTGETIFLPDEASADIIPVVLEPLAEDDLGIEMPPGLSFLGGVIVSFSGHELEAPAVLSLPVPAGLVDQDHVLLLRLMEIDGVTRLVFTGLGEIQGDSLVSLTSLPGMGGPSVEGILTEGRYIFARTSTAIGFSYGKVIDTQGSSLEGALVTVDDMPFVTVSGADGGYILAVNADMFSLTALDLETMDSGSGTGFISVADEVVELDVYLMANPPYVVSFSPVDGQINVPLETSIKITFSEPLETATATAQNLMLTGPEGPVTGTLTLASSNTQVTFRPTDALAANTTYAFTALPGIVDLAGYGLESIFVLSFTTLDTTPPPPPPAGNITATIPDNTGRTTITATQGTAGPHDTVSVINKTQNISSPVLVEADGSFSATIDANIIDEVVISITDPAGNETVVSTGLFRNPDGSVGVGPQGAQIEADNGAVLDIPEGAFPNGAIVRFTGLTEAEIGINPGPNFPFVLGFEIQCSVAPETYLNASAPMQAGVNPDITGIVARVVDVYGDEQALAIVDTAKIIDGRLTTSSPPCPGLEQRVGRYAMFLNEDERMAMGLSLISIIATGMNDVTIQALIESIGGDPENLYEFIALAGNSGHALNEMYGQTCLPVPPDTPLQVVIRDAETREALNILDIDPIEPFQSAHFHASVYYADTNDNTAPVVLGTNPLNRILDGYNKRIEIRFSEPVDHMALLGEGPRLISDAGEGEDETVYQGAWQLLENNTLLVFETNKQLPLGKKFRLHLGNIKDLAGNSYQHQPIIFSTYKPRIIFPTTSSHLNRTDIASALGIDEQNIPQELWFKDVDFITRSPDESYDGKWHTTLAALQGGLNWGGNIHRLFTLDLSDPTTPTVKGGSFTDPRFYQSRVRLLDNIDIIPREDSWADPQFWKRRLLYYQISDPSIRMCIDPADPDQEIYDQWVEKNCRPEDGGCGIINGGCGDLAITTVYDGKYSYL
ncbi:MAG: Ig-like domain-containing protein, partial [Deltaproteobacteria bacterium]|nr:Ig-like domain-containing protein [Deltaproteobacteria bacterium]